MASRTNPFHDHNTRSKPQIFVTPLHDDESESADSNSENERESLDITGISSTYSHYSDSDTSRHNKSEYGNISRDSNNSSSLLSKADYSPLTRRRQAPTASPSLSPLPRSPRSSRSPQSSRSRNVSSRSHLESNTSYNRHRNPKHEKTEKSSANINNLYILILGIILILLTILGIWLFHFKSSPVRSGGVQTMDNDQMYVMFKEQLKSLQAVYTSQSKRLWKTIAAATHHILSNVDPTHPAVVMLSAASDTNTLTCLGHAVVDAYNNVTDFTPSNDNVVIDGASFDHSNPAAEKMDLDDRLQAVLTMGHKAIFLNHLELLSPEAALFLHGFCDNDHAPYKDILLVLGVHTPTKEESSNVEPFINQLWSPALGVDKTSALLSRVANNIASVDPDFAKC